MSKPVSSPADQLSETMMRLRSLTQNSVQAGWRYCDEDLPIAQATQPDTWHNWTIAPLNKKDHIAWTKGKHVRWLGQVITVPHALQGYPLTGLMLRLGIIWWANKAQLFVNGEFVQEGDIFDATTRLLLSESVNPGDTFAIALRLVSPGHDDGALVRSLCHYESSTDLPEPSFIADELDILRLYLQTFAPEKLDLLAQAITQINWSTLPSPSAFSSLSNKLAQLLGKLKPASSASLAPSSRKPFDQILAKLRDRLLPLSPLLKQRRIRLLGHAHLDMAWLWTVDETWKAAERTFESALNLQKDFPELSFCHSTPALYEWIEQNRPALFERIRAAIAGGWWEPVGGLWIEPELNIISGESIVRQVLYGQRYFQEKFGTINRIAWLPDSFGFTWQLPQILKQGGIDYFVTQKLRWNDTTKFPYEVFQWQAPDRTEIFSLMSAPIGEGIDPIKMATYACDWETKTGIPDVLWLPGVGDHGGGPTRDMLEIARRWQRSPFFPQLEFSTALDYLQDLEAHYKPDVATDLRSEAQRAITQAQIVVNDPPTLTNESLTLNHESLILNDDTPTVSSESLVITDESLVITDESLVLSKESLMLNDETQRLTNEPSTLNHESPTLNNESPTLNNETQNSKLKTQNFPHSPLPTPHSLPSWHSDLYLEFHRGCYTTHADQKRFNRRSEELLYQAELWASLATLSAGVEYPKAELETAWKKVLFNQFHDILPGSSIKEVFTDANRAWVQAMQVGRDVWQRALNAIAQQITLPPPPHPDAQPIVVFNPLNWERSAVVELLLPENTLIRQVYNSAGQAVPYEQSPYREWLLFVENIPAIGYRIFWIHQETLPVWTPPGVDYSKPSILENQFLKVEIDSETGDLRSVFDKRQQREILSSKGNQLQAFKDEGQYWDAWNIDPNYAQKPLPSSELVDGVRWLEQGTLRSRIQVIRYVGNSAFHQDYVLETNSGILKILNEPEWMSSHVLVKAAFPLNLEANYATYEIPCGVIQRTTKPETEAEKAQWEVPAMHWADLGDGNYGVSLLNDCKYGYDAKPNQLRLTLLRGSEFPDPDADKGHHSFTYALYPHAGDWKAAQTVKHGYELNMPLIAQVIPAKGDDRPKTLPPTASLLDLGADNLVLMAFKQSEDSPNEWVLRCYECHGEDAQLNFQSDLGLELGERVDLLERSTDPPTIEGQTVKVCPWEIASFRVHRQVSS